MYTCPIQLSDVRYNAATQSFEAAVTVHDNATVKTYACAIAAPMTMRFEEAANGLSKQAIRRHQSRGGLFSELASVPSPVALRPHGKATKRWFQRLIDLPIKEAA